MNTIFNHQLQSQIASIHIPILTLLTAVRLPINYLHSRHLSLSSAIWRQNSTGLVRIL